MEFERFRGSVLVGAYPAGQKGPAPEMGNLHSKPTGHSSGRLEAPRGWWASVPAPSLESHLPPHTYALVRAGIYCAQDFQEFCT